MKSEFNSSPLQSTSNIVNEIVLRFCCWKFFGSFSSRVKRKSSWSILTRSKKSFCSRIQILRKENPVHQSILKLLSLFNLNTSKGLSWYIFSFMYRVKERTRENYLQVLWYIVLPRCSTSATPLHPATTSSTWLHVISTVVINSNSKRDNLEEKYVFVSNVYNILIWILPQIRSLYHVVMPTTKISLAKNKISTSIYLQLIVFLPH